MRGLLLLLIFIVVGCQAAGTNPSTIIHTTTDQEMETVIRLNIQDIDLHIPRPAGWESYKTDYGVVLTEHLGSIATDGQLNGLLLHVFVHPLEDSLEDFNALSSALSTEDSSNQAWMLLDAIIREPHLIGEATIGELQPFTWNGQDAAYYLTADGDDSATIVIGVIAPETQRLVAYNLSAPINHTDRIRAMLPALLDTVTINNVTFSGAELDFLPDPLVFPAD